MPAPQPSSVQIGIDLPARDYGYLNAAAKVELVRQLKGFGRDTLIEAHRLERNAHSAKGSPELTSSMIKDASLNIRKGIRPTRPRWVVMAATVSYASAILGGYFATVLDKPLGVSGFVVSTVAGCVSAILVYLKE